ncbi:MAG: hypothetical protein KDA57_16645 [Planctomycetales bacterium]|nr:hypothetical protein [Planctomycetales bacterium]
MTAEKNLPIETGDNLLEEAEKLIWAMLDDQIEKDDARRLEVLIKGNEHVRLRYLQCAQVHADLYEHYRVGTPANENAKTPVLGSLLSGHSLSSVDPSSLAD